MDTILCMLIFLGVVALLPRFLHHLVGEHIYNLLVYRDQTLPVERVQDIADIYTAMECAHHYFVSGAEKIVVNNERGICKKVVTRADFEREGGVFL